MAHTFRFIVFFFLLVNGLFAQQGNLIFIGHNTYNNEPLIGTTVQVYEDSKVIQMQNLAATADFKLTLPLGKKYKVSFDNAKTQKMFLEIAADNIPDDKGNLKMTYELTIPFFPKDATTFDVAQFEKPFHKIIYDGKKRMVDDTVYMKGFLENIYVKRKESAPAVVKTETSVKWINLAGKFTYDNPDKTPVTGKKVSLINSTGKVIKTISTNKFGTFIFTGVNLNDADKIELDFNKEFTTQNVPVKLSNMQNDNLGVISVSNNKTLWQNTKELRVIDKLVDTRFTYKIAAKLIAESGNKYEFYSNKTVLLLNDKNTVVKRGKTNVFGSFVFTDIKPGSTYLIGIEKSEQIPDKKVNLYTNTDEFVASVDSSATTRLVRRFSAENNSVFNSLLIDERNLKMNVGGKIYANDVNGPIGDLKILLLNDKMEVIDTTTSDNFGSFMFKYVPFNSQYSLTVDEKNQVLEAINNILVYSSEDELIKIVSLVKGRRFSYKPLNSEQSKMSDVYAEDPWLPLFQGKMSSKVSFPEIIIESILFESDKFNILPSAQLTLDKIALVLNSNDKIKIELSAHTDSQGIDSYNQTLSEQRAKSASDYILSKGVNASRVISKGYGETKILNRCKNNVWCPDDEHKINRRIEFKVIVK